MVVSPPELASRPGNCAASHNCSELFRTGLERTLMTSTVPGKVRLGELTAGELREIPQAAIQSFSFRWGATRDQGPHAPMGDYLLAEHVAAQIAHRSCALGVETFWSLLVLPFGGGNFFGSTPGGSADLPRPPLRAVLMDVLGCLLRHHLTRLVILNGHDGNVPCIHEVTSEISKPRDA